MKLASVLALASASGALGAWQVEQRNLATILLGIACPDDDTCFAGASQDGTGNVIFGTRDGGATYQALDMDPEGSQMTLMTTAATSADNVVTGGMGFGTPFQHTMDGQTFWNTEPFVLVGVTQNVQSIKGTTGGFGAAGDFADGNSVATSMDGGKTWDISMVEEIGASARYASFPTQRDWYVSGGSWPRDRSADAAVGKFELSSTVSLRKTMTNKTNGMELHVDKSGVPRKPGKEDGYRASVSRTSDGGQTWTEMFYDEGYYFNAIDCPTADSCFVVGEGQGSARIMSTQDGGRTWSVNWEAAGGYNLMGLEMLTEREGWACGSRIIDFDFDGVFLHTVDGGETWEESSLPGMFCMDLSFSSQGVGHATGLDIAGSSSTLVYRAN